MWTLIKMDNNVFLINNLSNNINYVCVGCEKEKSGWCLIDFAIILDQAQSLNGSHLKTGCFYFSAKSWPDWRSKCFSLPFFRLASSVSICTVTCHLFVNVCKRQFRFFSVFYKMKKMVNLRLKRNKQFTSPKMWSMCLPLACKWEVKYYLGLGRWW